MSKRKFDTNTTNNLKRLDDRMSKISRQQILHTELLAYSLTTDLLKQSMILILRTIISI